jgi:hypothetical protein
MPNYCDNPNPLSAIPVESTYDYEITGQNNSRNKPHRHVRQEGYSPVKHNPVTVPALGGDVQGRLDSNIVIGIRNIPVVCPNNIDKNKILITNDSCQFELKSMTAVETLVVESDKGLLLNTNELSIDYPNLISEGNLVTKTDLNDYVSDTGGTVDGELILNGNLKINELTSTATQLLVLDSSGNVNVQPNTTRRPETTSDSAAANNTIFYSSDSNKLSYKDPSGVVNALY